MIIWGQLFVHTLGDLRRSLQKTRLLFAHQTHVDRDARFLGAENRVHHGHILWWIVCLGGVQDKQPGQHAWCWFFYFWNVAKGAAHCACNGRARTIVILLFRAFRGVYAAGNCFCHITCCFKPWWPIMVSSCAASIEETHIRWIPTCRTISFCNCVWRTRAFVCLFMRALHTCMCTCVYSLQTTLAIVAYYPELILTMRNTKCSSKCNQTLNYFLESHVLIKIK